MKEFKDCRNPVLGVELHIPDAEAHVMPDGRVYVYGSWDQYDEDVYCSKEYRVVSSENMVDWIDHGTAFASDKVHWINNENKPNYPGVDWDYNNCTPIQKIIIERMMQAFGITDVNDFTKLQQNNTVNDMLFAPDAIYRNGKYYLYFCLSDDSEGVAISDKPEGPFSDPIQLPCAGIDPAVFIDDDGQAYYYWGQFRSSGAKLKNNMVEFEEASMVHRLITEEEHGFHEGSSLRKRNGIYYYVYTCIKRGKATSLAYATSKSPLGPYEYKGIIIDNDGCDPQSWNNHGSIEEVNGQWYVFYHRSSQNKKVRRRLCIEPIYFNDDGSIQEVLMTSQGAGRSFGCGEKIDAYRACQLSGGVYITPLEDGYEGLAGINNGDTVIYRYVQWDSAVKTVSIKATGSGEIKIYLDGESELAGSVLLMAGEVIKSDWKTSLGKHEIKLQFDKVDNLVLRSIEFA